MPSSPGYKRNYKQESRTAKRRGEVSTGSGSDNAKRHRARRLMLKKGMVKPGQDVGHKKALQKGGSNNISNLRAESPSANRGFPRTKKAGMK